MSKLSIAPHAVLPRTPILIAAVALLLCSAPPRLADAQVLREEWDTYTAVTIMPVLTPTPLPADLGDWTGLTGSPFTLAVPASLCGSTDVGLQYTEFAPATPAGLFLTSPDLTAPPIPLVGLLGGVSTVVIGHDPALDQLNPLPNPITVEVVGLDLGGAPTGLSDIVTLDPGSSCLSVLATLNDPNAVFVQLVFGADGTLPLPPQALNLTFVEFTELGEVDPCLPDIEPPVINCLGGVIAFSDPGQCGSVVTFSDPTASDNCDPAPIVVCNPPSGSFFPVGITTVTCTATDAAGLSASCAFPLQVVDSEDPVITCPADITVPNDFLQCGADVVYPLPSASDNCPGVNIACSPASGSFFPVGTTTVVCTATDAAGRQSECEFDVTVNDTEPPGFLVTFPPPFDNDPGQCGAVVNFSSPQPFDNCPGASVAQTGGPASGSFFPVGNTLVEFLVTDAAGLTTPASFSIVVNDTESPVITCSQLPDLQASGSPCQALLPDYLNDPAFAGLITASDNCSVTVTQTPPPGTPVSPGPVVLVFTATDPVLLEDSCSATVNVLPCPPPVVLINELKANAPGFDDDMEFVELRGCPDIPLDGVYFVALDGDGAAAGSADFVVDLTGLTVGPNELLIILSPNHPYLPDPDTVVVLDQQMNDNVPGPALENGSLSSLLIYSPGVPIAEGTDYDADNNGTLEGLPPGAVIIDSVAWLNSTLDLPYAPVLGQPTLTPGAAVRFPADTTPNSAPAWYNGALDLGGTPDTVFFDADPLVLSANFPAGGILTPGAPNVPGQPTELDCPVDCNGDGIPDDQQLGGVGVFGVSPTLNGIFFPNVPSHTFPAVPSTSGDIEVRVDADADLDSSIETIDVRVNGTFVGTLFVSGGNQCAPSSEALIIPGAIWAGLVPGPGVTIDLAPSSSVGNLGCADTAVITLTEVAFANDVNNNGIPDDCEPATIGDLVFHDLDADGRYEASQGETPIAGVRVDLVDAISGLPTGLFDVSDGAGAWGISNVPPGNYFLVHTEDVPGSLPGFEWTRYVSPVANRNLWSDVLEEFQPVSAVPGTTPPFTLGPNEVRLDFAAGMYRRGSLDGRVWLDKQAVVSGTEGIQDPGEPGLGGIPVLLVIQGQPSSTWQTTATAGDGTYSFSNLIPGTSLFSVQFALPGAPLASVFSPANVGGDDTVDSDVAISGGAQPGYDGRTVALTVLSDQSIANVDAGMIDRTSPLVVEVRTCPPACTPEQSVAFDLLFNEPVFQAGMPAILTTNTSFVSLTPAGPQPVAAWTVNITAAAEGPVTAALASGGVQDTAMNPNALTPLCSWIYDATAPLEECGGELAGLSGSLTTDTTLFAWVTFTEDVFNVDPTDFVLGPAGTIVSVTPVSGPAASYLIEYTVPGPGIYTLTFNQPSPDWIEDCAGNDFPGSNSIVIVEVVTVPCGVDGNALQDTFGASSGDHFGWDVDVDDVTALVGVPDDDDVTSGLQSTGSVVVYVWDGVSTWLVKQVLVPSVFEQGQQFGRGVSIAGDWAAVGASRENANGITNSGAVYVFRRDANTGLWAETQRLTPPSGPNFMAGEEVALWGSTLVVAIPQATTSNGSFRGGRLAVYEYDACIDTWSLAAEVEAPDASGYDAFATSVDVFGNIIAAGSPGDDDNGSRTGSAYFFRRTGAGLWVPDGKVVPATAATGDNFGHGVALGSSAGGLLAVCGAPSDDDAGLNTGAVYRLRRVGAGNWVQVGGTIVAGDPQTGSQFGKAVDTDGTTIAVGAPKDPTAARDAGSFYAFRAATAAQIAKYLPPQADRSDNTGHSVSVSGATILGGAPNANLVPPPGGFSRSPVGAAYIYCLRQ